MPNQFREQETNKFKFVLCPHVEADDRAFGTGKFINLIDDPEHGTVTLALCGLCVNVVTGALVEPIMKKIMEQNAPPFPHDILPAPQAKKVNPLIKANTRVKIKAGSVLDMSEAAMREIVKRGERGQLIFMRYEDNRALLRFPDSGVLQMVHIDPDTLEPYDAK